MLVIIEAPASPVGILQIHRWYSQCCARTKCRTTAAGAAERAGAHTAIKKEKKDPPAVNRLEAELELKVERPIHIDMLPSPGPMQ